MPVCASLESRSGSAVFGLLEIITQFAVPPQTLLATAVLLSASMIRIC
jgi:hypothetical protein